MYSTPLGRWGDTSRRLTCVIGRPTGLGCCDEPVGRSRACPLAALLVLEGVEVSPCRGFRRTPFPRRLHQTGLRTLRWDPWDPAARHPLLGQHTVGGCTATGLNGTHDGHPDPGAATLSTPPCSPTRSEAGTAGLHALLRGLCRGSEDKTPGPLLRLCRERGAPACLGLPARDDAQEPVCPPHPQDPRCGPLHLDAPGPSIDQALAIRQGNPTRCCCLQTCRGRLGPRTVLHARLDEAAGPAQR